MKKRLFSALLCLCMVVCILPTVSFAAETASGTVTWSLSDDGTLTFRGTGKMGYDTSWLNNKDDIKQVIIEDGVIDIEMQAFKDCENLTSITIPNSVTSIGEYAFRNCKRLTGAILPNSVRSVGEFAFQDCTSLTNVTISNSMTSIENNTFSGCSSLKSITIPNSVTSIGNGVFAACSNLQSITIPDSVTDIGNAVFNGCTSLESAEIGSGVTNISFGMFSDCSSLQSITIPDSVQSIGMMAFNGCKSLKSVTIPRDVKSIEMMVFFNCSSLKSVTIPNGVTSIGNSAFYSCESLTSVTIPDSVTSIGNSAFLGCSSLKQITIPTGVVTFGDYAFGMYYDYKTTSYQVIEDFTARVTKDSAAQAYCEKNGIRYETEHHWDAGVITKKASCTESGVKTYTCETCKETKTEDIPATGHKPITDAAIAPTCTAAGKTEGSHCETCGATLTAQNEVPATGHHFVDGTCTSCGAEDPNYLPPIRFTDVDADQYYAKPVQWAVAKNITNGMGDNRFEPQTTCTRGQIVTFLWRAKGEPEPSSNYNPFRDVSESDYYYKAVLWAVENGITTGTSATTFAPNAGCTRAQVATFLWRAEGKPSSSAANPFTDVNTSAYYGTAVLWAVENGITDGIGNNQFAPDMTCTRGQIVTFLYRAMA